jgi:hypothetical protein
MAISEFEFERCEKALNQFMAKHRPPVHVREQLDICYRIEYQNVEIYEVIPGFRDSSKKTEIPAAKATFVKSRQLWKVYWLRLDLKWHTYTPKPEVNTLEEFLQLVGEDSHRCFFG